MLIGLLGEKLGHSFSKAIHEQLADYTYNLIEKDAESMHQFMTQREFKAINVTIPYKEKVIPYCDFIDEKAQKIQAVNAIVNRDGKLYATNTDFDGLKWMLEHANISIQNKTCLILGTGGTSKTAKAVLESMNAKKILQAGRNKPLPVIPYSELSKHQDIQVIINATSVGMYPDNNKSLIDLSNFPQLEAVADVIYNPLKTRLCQQAEKLGIRHVNGLDMLVAQAKTAIEFFLDTQIDDSKINEISQQMRKNFSNIVLIGMPGCGKSSVAKVLSECTDKKLVDLDELIVSETNMEIKDIFAQYGEARFRELEHEICLKTAKEHGLIISCGGGIIKDERNIDALKQNGIVFHLLRDLEKLSIDDSRPLSSSFERLKIMEKERMPLYQAASDETIDNNGQLVDTVSTIKERFDEILNY